MLSEDIRILLQKYLDDQCSEREVEQVFELLKTPPGQKVMAQVLVDNQPAASQTAHKMPAGASERMLSHLQQSLQTEKRQTRPLWQQMRRLAVAASIVLILGFGLSMGSSGDKIWEMFFPIKYTTIAAPQNQLLQAILPDGTHIQLNAGSKIRFAQNFIGRQEREVNLTGEAFFAVAHNPLKPFRVKVKQAQVEVLGTEFNVKEDVADTLIVVAVSKGKVAFHMLDSPKETSLTLLPGDVGTARQGAVSKRHVSDVANYLSWFNKRLVFRETSMGEVARQLEQIYGVSIVFLEPAIANRRVTVNIQREPLPRILDKLAEFLYISYQVEGKQILLNLPHKSKKP
jgi:ferric-dicitrate binding protein FerR (iron transport regulator)